MASRFQRRKRQKYDGGVSSDPCSCKGCDIPCFDLLFIVPSLGVPSLRERRATLPGRLGASAIRGYQRHLSAHLPTRCRYTPTCRQYGLVAVQRYGLVAGSRLTAARIRRCGPGVPHGTHDPVPSGPGEQRVPNSE